MPLNEAWLFQNKTALKAVKKGLTQAHSKEFAEDPRAGNNDDWLKDIED